MVMICTLEKFKRNRPTKVIKWFSLDHRNDPSKHRFVFNLCDASFKIHKGFTQIRACIYNGSLFVFFCFFFKSSIHHTLPSLKARESLTLHTFYSDIFKTPKSWSFDKDKTLPGSRVDLEGQECFGVQVVERAEVRKLEEQLGEDGGLVGVVLHDQTPQRTDKVVLQHLHRIHVLDT